MTKDDTKKDQNSELPDNLLKENNPEIAKIIEDMQHGVTIEKGQEQPKQKLTEQSKTEQNTRQSR